MVNNEAKWEPIPYKLIKALKNGCAKYGPTSPYVPSLIDKVSGSCLFPTDRSVLARLCLPGVLLWKAGYDDEIHALLSTEDIKPKSLRNRNRKMGSNGPAA